MTWRWRLRPMLGVLAVVVAFAGAVHTDRASFPFHPSVDHQVRELANVHSSRLAPAEALPASGRAAAVRHGTSFWRIPAGVVPTAATLAAIALAALLASVVRSRRLTETPTRLPPRAPPAAGTCVPGHGVGLRPAPALLGFGAVPVPG